MNLRPFKILFLVLWYNSPVLLFAQIIPNMSFEGTPQENVPPTGWSPCHEYSTPDTQPGFWEVTKEPSDGASYIGMVTRGNLGPYANHNEDIQAELLAPLLTGKTYNFQLDLSLSENWGHFIDFGSTFLSYDTPAKLQIFGGSGPCDRQELLWESPAIDHTDWKSYSVTLNPEVSDVKYLILQPDYIGESTYFGNILVDNFVECFIDLDVISDTTICEHEPLVLDVSVPNGSYEWQDGSTEPVYTISSAGTYEVTVSNECISESFEINVETRNCFCDTAFPIETQAYDSLICENDSLILDATTPGGVYSWNDGSVESTILVTQPGLYTVEVSNKCEAETFEFFIEDKQCDCEISAPNVFTPNGDGINDTFGINGMSDIARFNLSIFSRSGEAVYQSDKLNDVWNGTRNGKDLPSGVYYWTIDIMCIRGTSILDNNYKGIITILR